jgi:hypothetical protein
MWGADRWHSHTKQWLDECMRKLDPISKEASVLLHVGSAGRDYGLRGKLTCHVDIADNTLASVPNAVIGDVHALPIAPASVDLCVCVGSVINYCDAVFSLFELCSVIKPGGHLVLEFESSGSWEYLWSDVYQQGVTTTRTFYGADSECTLWLYSTKYIKELLFTQGFMVKEESRVHVISSLVYKLTRSEGLSAKFARMDNLFRNVPLVRKGASNVIWLCQKLPSRPSASP